MHRAFLMKLSLFLLTSALCLVAGEVVLRVIAGQPLGRLKLFPRFDMYKPPPDAVLEPWARTWESAAGTEADWIDDHPAFRRRPPVSPDLQARLEKARGWSGLRQDLVRVFNEQWLRESACPNATKPTTMPGGLYFFTPEDGRPNPVYRFPPNKVLYGGLATNAYGWRGPDLALDKPPGVIRLAFVGASTTIGSPRLPYSYPEYMQHWLDRWTREFRPQIRFEVLNAAREGIGSSNLEAIVRKEVLPLEPDLVVYYEGVNQFNLKGLTDLDDTALPKRGKSAWAGVQKKLTDWGAHSMIARGLSDGVAVLDANGGREPDKPEYVFTWPAHIDEFEPDLRLTGRLPTSLHTILSDLDLIRTEVREAGAELALMSFKWLVHDGMRLNPLTDEGIQSYYQRKFWPFRYRDIRRVADFQNTVFERYAAAHRLPFVDLAGLFPDDPSFFSDGVHFRRKGIRLQAWIVFQQLLPYIEKQLDSGVWPRPDERPQTTHPAFAEPRLLPNGCADLG